MADDQFERAASTRRTSFLGEFWAFARANRRWWLTPVLLILLVVGALVVLTSTAVGPFIYTLF